LTLNQAAQTAPASTPWKLDAPCKMQNPVPSLNDEKSHTALKGLDSKDE
jgi:hypothetical protein